MSHKVAFIQVWQLGPQDKTGTPTIQSFLIPRYMAKNWGDKCCNYKLQVAIMNIVRCLKYIKNVLFIGHSCPVNSLQG